MPLLDKHKQKKQMSYLGKQISKALNYQVLGKKKPAAKPAKKPAPKPKVTHKSTPKPTAPKNKIKPPTVSTKPSPKRMSPPTAPKKRGTGQKIAKRITGGGTRDTGRHAPKPPTGSPKKPLAATKMAKKKAPARKVKGTLARRGY